MIIMMIVVMVIMAMVVVIMEELIMMLPTVISRSSMQATSRRAEGQPKPPGFTLNNHCDDHGNDDDLDNYNDYEVNISKRHTSQD